MVSKLWIQVEVLAGVIEWPFITWQLYIVLVKQSKIITAALSEKTPEQKKLQELNKVHLERLEERATDKSEFDFEEDFFTLTCFSYLKVNADHATGWGIKPEKQSQMLYSSLLVMIVVLSMLFCMLTELLNITET